MTFHDRPGKYTAQDLYDELMAQMDIMFAHNINGVDWEDIDDDADRVLRARDTFENENGLPSSSTVYGIFMNSYGASVFAISGSPGHSDGVILDDVHIHGLYKDPWEVPRISLTKGPFNDIMDLTVCGVHPFFEKRFLFRSLSEFIEVHRFSIFEDC